jgi:hypothetical protein
VDDSGFDKRGWITEHKQLKKEYILEDRERFRPLLRIKKDVEIRDFMEEIEKMEKKNEIGCMREQGTITQFVLKQRQDVDCARTMIQQSKSGDVSMLDRIQTKCQMVEQNLKNFKLKSRATY